MKFKNKLSLIIFSWFLLISLFLTSTALAGTFDQVIKGFAQTGQQSGYSVGSGGQPNKQFTSAWPIYLNGFLTIMGAFFLVIIIYGGFLWMTAHGNEQQVEKAKGWILQAIIGLGVILGGRIIVEITFYALGSTIGQIK
jgi:preprotein translocase subunit SecG